LLDGFWLAATSSPWVALGIIVFLLHTAVRLVHAAAHPGNNRDPLRRFSSSDKNLILSRAGGRCEHHAWIFGRCRKTERLEADHVHPHSRGGQTAPENGQALCRRHNLAKRATIPFKWQLRALERRRAGYFPAGVPATVVRKATRPKAGRPSGDRGRPWADNGKAPGQRSYASDVRKHRSQQESG
jgi:5-methylcytosine-specific restriction endonuclease McrA